MSRNTRKKPVLSILEDHSTLKQEEESLFKDDDIPTASVIRIPPFSYIHVLDTNQNVTRLEVGPKSLTCLDHEKVVFGPEKMVVVPPRHYCTIHNPVVTKENGEVVLDKYGQAKLQHGDSEIRFEKEDAFPLYPGEVLVGGVQQLKIMDPDQALRLRAIRNFTDKFTLDPEGKPLKRQAGEEWLFEGPGTYIPQVEVEIIETVRSYILGLHQALHLKARNTFVDRNKCKRKAGEEWLVQIEGAYLPGVDEQVIKVINGRILHRNKIAVHLRATNTFVDTLGKQRKAGDEWLVKYEDHEVHIPDVYEEVVNEVRSIVLNWNQYCVISDPVDENGKPQLGQRKLVKGQTHFFLQPGESLVGGVLMAPILAPGDALLVRAKESFEEKRGKYVRNRKPGNRWLVYGPGKYFPPIEVQVIQKRRALIQIDFLNLYLFYSKISLALFVLLIIILWISIPRLVSAYNVF